MGKLLRFGRIGLRGRKAKVLAVALAATSALTPLAVSAHDALRVPPTVTVAPADAPGAAQHADHVEKKAERRGVWRGVAGAIGSGAGAVWLFLRRAGTKVVKPMLKAAAKTARIALGGASVIGQVGLWAGRVVLGALVGLIGLMAAFAGLAQAGPGATLLLGAVLGAAATAAIVWAGRRVLFRPRRAA